MEGESGVTRSAIDKLHSSDIEVDQMKDEIVVTRSIIDELHSSDMPGSDGTGKWCYSRYH